MLTYFEILYYFIIPPILLLLVLTKRRGIFDQYNLYNPKIGIFALSLVAFIYTSPWDNYLVASGVWFYDELLVSGLTIYWVPIEEYLFFILETILVSLVFLNLLRQDTINNPLKISQSSVQKYKRITQVLLVVVWLISVILFIVNEPKFTYLSLILLWAIPPILLQVSYGFEILVKYRAEIFVSILVSTVYLSIVDSIAIYYGTWTISNTYSVSILLFNVMPVEEVLFFFITCVLVTLGMTLATSMESIAKLQVLIQRYRTEDRVRIVI